VTVLLGALFFSKMLQNSKLSIILIRNGSCSVSNSFIYMESFVVGKAVYCCFRVMIKLRTGLTENRISAPKVAVGGGDGEEGWR
jgi:hypothetical protein